MSRRTGLRVIVFVLGVALAAIAVWFAISEIQWDAVGRALLNANRTYFAIGVFFYLMAKVSLAIRWIALLRTRVKMPTNVAFLHIMVAYFVNNALPFRGGEILRLVMAQRRGGGSPHFYIGCMVIERTIDAVILSLMIACLSLVLDVPSAVSIAVFTLAGFAFAIFACAFAFPDKRDEFLSRLPQHAPTRYVRQALRDLSSSLSLIRGKNLAIALAFSIVSWGAASIMYYCWQLSFSLDLPIFVAPLQMLSTTLATAIVSTPGGIGVYHQVVIMLLGAWGIDRNIAFGFAAATHAIHLLAAVTFGIVGLLREQLTRSHLLTASHS